MAVTNFASEHGFPTFASLFQRADGIRVSLYLTLLNLCTLSEARIALAATRRAIAESPDVTGEISALFREYNWRPQLVGAAAIVLGAENSQTLAELWLAFDSGSWVSPQLAVVARRCDPDFEAAARTRIENGCPIRTNRLASLDWATRHSAAGPGSFASHSAKALAALIAMCSQLPGLAEPDSWLQQTLADTAVQEILKRDMDGGAEIAKEWDESIAVALLDLHSPETQ